MFNGINLNINFYPMIDCDIMIEDFDSFALCKKVNKKAISIITDDPSHNSRLQLMRSRLQHCPPSHTCQPFTSNQHRNSKAQQEDRK